MFTRPHLLFLVLPKDMIDIQDILANNPYFSAGAGVVGLTAASGLALKGASKAAFYLKRRLLVTIEIPIKDGIYPWFLEWMAKRNQETLGVAWNSQKSLVERLFSQRFHQLQVETRLIKHENGSISSNFSLVPGNGKHFLQYKNAWFQIERNRTSTMVGTSIYIMEPFQPTHGIYIISFLDEHD